MAKSDLKNRKKEIEALVELVKKGEKGAFAKLYDIFVDPLFRYIYYRVNANDAEDLLETVFLKVWENIDKYTSGRNLFSAWIFRIAHNIVVDYYRVNKDKKLQELSINIPTYKREHNPIRVAEDVLNNDLLKSALGKLKARYREIIIYKFINELSNKEIAQILKKSEGSLRILQFRALKALKKELEIVGLKYTF